MANQETEGYIPVYLPDRTVVGKATIDGQDIVIKMSPGNAIQSLIKENLIGLSVMYMGPEARDAFDNCEDPDCYRGDPHSHGSCYANCAVCQAK